MTQTYLSKTTIESGESPRYNNTVSEECRKYRRRGKSQITKMLHSGDFDLDDGRQLVSSVIYSRHEKFTDKLGALRRWVASCDGMHINEFNSKVKEKFSTGNGFVALDHIKEHIYSFIFDETDPLNQGRFKYFYIYSVLILGSDEILRKNTKAFHRENNRTYEPQTTFNESLWDSVAKGRLLGKEGNIWYWYDGLKFKRVAKLTEKERQKVKVALGSEMYISSRYKRSKPISLKDKEEISFWERQKEKFRLLGKPAPPNPLSVECPFSRKALP